MTGTTRTLTVAQADAVLQLLMPNKQIFPYMLWRKEVGSAIAALRGEPDEPPLPAGYTLELREGVALAVLDPTQRLVALLPRHDAPAHALAAQYAVEDAERVAQREAKGDGERG